MKLNKYLLLVAAGTVAFTTGCNQDELDIPQKGVISIDNFYQTDADAESAMTAVYAATQIGFASNNPNVASYNYGPYFAITTWMGDDVWFGGTGTDDCVEQRHMHHFVYDADHRDIEVFYSALYSSILKCNYVINNFTEERLGSLSETQKRCVAEARTMRAFCHLLLGIYWGTPAIVETELDPADRPTNAESQEAVMQWVADECDLAAADLPWRKGTEDKEGTYRVTKGFALALKGKALLWKEDYAGAKAALAEVINSGNYALVPSEKMITIGHADGKGSSEAVFEFNFEGASISEEYQILERGGWNDHNTFCLFRGGLFDGKWVDQRAYTGGWQWINPSGDFSAALIENDGMESVRRQAWIKTYDEILYDYQWESDGDNFTPGKTAAKAKDPARGVKKGQRLFANNGYFQYKISAHPNQGDQLPNSQLTRNVTIMRYAEVLLMYAEACAQLNETSGEGLKALNDIQNRAKSKTVSSALSLAAVQKEKMLELWLEGCRFADVVRWGKHDQSVLEPLKNADKNLPTMEDALVNGEAEHGIYFVTVEGLEPDVYVKEFGELLGFKDGKHNLLPFPKRALELNPALKQNPGW